MELKEIMGADNVKAALDKAIKSMEQAAAASAAMKDAFDAVKFQVAYRQALENGYIKQSEPSQKPKKRAEPPRPQTFGEWS